MIERQLTLYRLHLIDPKTGTIARTHIFHAENDSAALRFAEIWAELAPMELRGQRRLVKRWDAPDKDDSPPS